MFSDKMYHTDCNTWRERGREGRREGGGGEEGGREGQVLTPSSISSKYILSILSLLSIS